MNRTAAEIIAEWRASNLNNDDGELASRFNLWLMQQLGVGQLEAGHLGWHVARGATHAVQYWPVATAQEPAPAQADIPLIHGKSELDLHDRRVLGEFVGYISVEYRWPQERWENCLKLAEKFLAAREASHGER